MAPPFRQGRWAGALGVTVVATAAVSVAASLAAVAVRGAPSRASIDGSAVNAAVRALQTLGGYGPPSTQRCTVSPKACPDAQAKLTYSYQSHQCLANTATANDVLAEAQAEMDKFVDAGCCSPAKQPQLLEALLDLVKLDTCVEGVEAASRRHLRHAPPADADGRAATDAL